MTGEQVMKYLTEYRMNRARHAHLSVMIARAQKELGYEAREDMEGMMLGAALPSGMPRTTGICSPVERAVQRLEEGTATPMTNLLAEEIAHMERERDELETRVEYVEAWLSGLLEEERYVVERQVMNGEVWREVVQGYAKRFGIELSKDTLKRMRDRTLARIERVAA